MKHKKKEKALEFSSINYFDALSYNAITFLNLIFQLYFFIFIIKKLINFICVLFKTKKKILNF